MRSGKVTIKDVAVEAGVSVASVSRVLNGVSTVERSIRDRVHAAAERLQYHPDGMARGLRKQTNTVIGITLPDIGNPFLTAVVRGAEDAALEAGYLLMLCNTDDDTVKESRYLGMLAGQAVAGILVIPADEESTDVESIIKRGIPIVTVDRRLRRHDVDSVLGDNLTGAELAVQSLFDRGYRRIATIAGPDRTTTGLGRLAGYRSGMQRCGLPIDPELAVDGGFSVDGGYAAASTLLDLPERPDGIFIANSAMAVGAIEALSDRGLEVGDDLGIVCFDDLPRGVDPHHRIAVVMQPGYHIGRTAVEMLLTRIAGDTSPTRTVQLEPSMRRAPDGSLRTVA